MQRDRFGACLERVVEELQLCVRGEELKVGLGYLRPDHRTHGFPRVLRSEQIVLRRARRGPELAPEVDFVRGVHADAVVVVDRREAEKRNRADLSHAIAVGIDAEIDRRIKVGLCQLDLGACGVDARDRSPQVEVLGKRFVDEPGKHGIVERAPPLLERRIGGAGGKVELRWRGGCRRAACDGDDECDGENGLAHVSLRARGPAGDRAYAA